MKALSNIGDCILQMPEVCHRFRFSSVNKNTHRSGWRLNSQSRILHFTMTAALLVTMLTLPEWNPHSISCNKPLLRMSAACFSHLMLWSAVHQNNLTYNLQGPQNRCFLQKLTSTKLVYNYQPRLITVFPRPGTLPYPGPDESSPHPQTVPA
jgi:hypothetical protein